MYIKESEIVKITISDISKTKWEKKIGKKIEFCVTMEMSYLMVKVKRKL